VNRFAFPWLAFGIGLLLAAFLFVSGARNPGAPHALPLLTLLIVTEFAFFLTAIGAVLGARALLRRGLDPGLSLTTLGCAALAVGFLVLGISLWPGG